MHDQILAQSFLSPRFTPSFEHVLCRRPVLLSGTLAFLYTAGRQCNTAGATYFHSFSLPPPLFRVMIHSHGKKGKYHESETSPAILLCMSARKGRERISSPAWNHFLLIRIRRFVSSCNPIISEPAVLPSLVPYCSILQTQSCSPDLRT